MNAEILAIGSELLLGETIDTNSAYLARQLTGIGINLFRKTVIGDNEIRIANTIAEVLERTDLLICTGGLGPTPDDVTRESIARATGRPLEFHQHLLDQIEARFRSFGRTMSPSNRQQAYVPQGARIVENPRGTAPSFILEDARGTIVVLPGVPSEMRFLWEHAILPYLRDERGETGLILVRTLHATGMSESAIGEILADLMVADNPTLGISAKRGQYELRIGAKANARAEAEAMADQAEATIRERLGSYVLGEQTLEQTTLTLLAERQITLALYEGMVEAPIYRALAATPQGKHALRGAIVHPLDVPADDTAARSLAITGAGQARDRWRADYGLGVQAGPQASDGFSTVFLALEHAEGQELWERRIELSSEEGYGFVATSAFDGLRRFLGA